MNIYSTLRPLAEHEPGELGIVHRAVAVAVCCLNQRVDLLLGSGLAHRMHNRAQLPGVDGACAEGGGGVIGVSGI